METSDILVSLQCVGLEIAVLTSSLPCSDVIILSSCSEMLCTVAVTQMFHFTLQMVTLQF